MSHRAVRGLRFGFQMVDLMFVPRENLRQEAGLINLNVVEENWATFGLHERRNEIRYTERK